MNVSKGIPITDDRSDNRKVYAKTRASSAIFTDDPTFEQDICASTKPKINNMSVNTNKFIAIMNSIPKSVLPIAYNRILSELFIPHKNNATIKDNSDSNINTKELIEIIDKLTFLFDSSSFASFTNSS